MKNISLTIRLPHELNTQLTVISKKLGVTKTNFIRSAIHDFLTIKESDLNFSYSSKKTDRLVLNVNQLTHNILQEACQTYNQSINAIVIAVSILALERATKWLQSTQH